MAMTDEPPPQLTMEVSVGDIASKIIESETGPRLSMFLNVKLDIAELLQALTDFQLQSTSIQVKEKPEIPQQLPKAKVEIAPPNIAPVLAQSLVPPLVPAAAPASIAAPPVSTNAAQQREPVIEPAALEAMNFPGAAPPQGPPITWDTPLDELQPRRGEQNTTPNTWTAPTRNWTLLDAGLLQKLKVQRIKTEPLLAKKPTQNTAHNNPQTAEQALAAALKGLSDGAVKGVGSPPPQAPPPKPAPSKPAPAAVDMARSIAQPLPETDKPPVPPKPPPAPPTGPSGPAFLTSPTEQGSSPTVDESTGEQPKDGKECKQQ